MPFTNTNIYSGIMMRNRLCIMYHSTVNVKIHKILLSISLSVFLNVWKSRYHKTKSSEAAEVSSREKRKESLALLCISTSNAIKLN